VYARETLTAKCADVRAAPQLRKLGSSGSVTLSDTRADGWHTVVRSLRRCTLRKVHMSPHARSCTHARAAPGGAQRARGEPAVGGAAPAARAQDRVSGDQATVRALCTFVCSFRAAFCAGTAETTHARCARRRVGAERSLPLDTHFSSVCTLTDRCARTQRNAHARISAHISCSRSERAAPRLRSVRVEGTVRVEAAGAGRTRQRFAGTVNVALPSVGPLVEKMIVAAIARSYTHMPAIVEEWMQARLCRSDRHLWSQKAHRE
jgi:hypothetical protein